MRFHLPRLLERSYSPGTEYIPWTWLSYRSTDTIGYCKPNFFFLSIRTNVFAIGKEHTFEWGVMRPFHKSEIKSNPLNDLKFERHSTLSLSAINFILKALDLQTTQNAFNFIFLYYFFLFSWETNITNLPLTYNEYHGPIIHSTW